MDLNNCYLLEYHTGNYEFSYNPREGRGFKHQPGEGGWSPMVVIDREAVNCPEFIRRAKRLLTLRPCASLMREALLTALLDLELPYLVWEV